MNSDFKYICRACRHNLQMIYFSEYKPAKIGYFDKCFNDSICYKIEPIIYNQPERSKREDLDCCTRVEDLDDLLNDFHIEFCHGGDPYKSISHYSKSCDLLMKLIQESKMRCSERSNHN